MDSIIISHVAEEAANFAPSFVDTPSGFRAYLENAFRGSGLSRVRNAIEAQYPNHYWTNQQTRLTAILDDVVFLCNTRYLFDAYKKIGTPVYMMKYFFFNNLGLAKHGSDLLPTFWSRELNVEEFLIKYGDISAITAARAAAQIVKLAPAYQSYFASHAISGDPNKHRDNATTVEWTEASYSSDGQKLENVMDVSYGLRIYFGLQEESQATADTCAFWLEAASNITKAFKEADAGEAAALRKQWYWPFGSEL